MGKRSQPENLSRKTSQPENSINQLGNSTSIYKNLSKNSNGNLTEQYPNYRQEIISQ